MHVSVRFTRPSIERAKGADNVAHIRIINIAVDYVGDNIAGILSLTDLVSSETDTDKIVGFEKRRSILGGQSLTVESFVQNRLNKRFHLLYFSKAGG